MTAFDKGGLKIEFDFEKVPSNPANIVTISLKVCNFNPVPITDFLFQAAVPKVSYCS